MKEQLYILKDIQLIDLETDKTSDLVDVHRKKLEEYQGVFELLTKDLERHQLALEETRNLRREKESDLQKLQERYIKAKAKLQAVSTMKEQTAAEQESDSLKRSISKLEGEYLELDEAIQVSETNITEMGNKVQEINKIIRTTEEDVEKSVVESEAQLKSVEKKRKRLLKKINAYVLRHYEFIRSRRGGKALAPAENGYCTACYMSLQPQLFNEIQRGDSLKTCPTCQRILYFVAPE